MLHIESGLSQLVLLPWPAVSGDARGQNELLLKQSKTVAEGHEAAYLSDCRAPFSPGAVSPHGRSDSSTGSGSEKSKSEEAHFGDG